MKDTPLFFFILGVLIYTPFYMFEYIANINHYSCVNKN